MTQTLRARALSLALKESRAAAVSPIEEERRRWRRDLHDGFGRDVVGHRAHTADAARNSIGSDPEAAAALLLHLRGVAALRQQAAGIEVAAYRIAIEAVTNASRHSGTDQAWVVLSCTGDDLTVSVRDAGSSSGAWVPGVALSSMRERAAEVGGLLSVSTKGEGSVVRALLPLG